ncbi:BRO-N domain-containing protein [Microbulbifer sp. JMSA002]|uniref:BRO-N domain-containing protein n=1 Tax=Microbulbifer sp. JMSA002 TaxID=3243368 RepID=UPI0040390F42
MILTSQKTEAKAFKRWVTHEVLPSIRKTGQYSHQQPSGYPELEIAECAARMLRMSDSSKVRMLSTICTERGVSDRFLPDYVQEAPVKAHSDLLKEHGASLSARAVNPILISMGYLEELQRRSSRGGIKKFKSLTQAGLRFGRNETCPRNPRETQPLYYVETFPELLDQINAWKNAA